jgi:hypothetical protein
MSQELFQPFDPRYFRAQVTRIHREGYRVIRCSGGQLKVGPVSYYPSTGTILKDGSKKERVLGIDAFLQILSDMGIHKVRRSATPQGTASAESEFAPSTHIKLNIDEDDE